MSRLTGIIVAPITPRGKQGDADFGAALELIDFHCKAGVHGIALLGATGEFASLSADERTRLVYLAARRSRAPILAGVGHATLDGAVSLAREACGAGAAGLLAMPPIFYRYDQNEIREFYLQFAAQAGRATPIYLYNVPSFTSPIEIETAQELLATGLFAGIKDSSGSFDYFDRLREERERLPFTLMIGNDLLFARGRATGADGAVSGVACAVPELLVALDRAIEAGDRPRVQTLDSRLHEFIAWLDCFPTPVGIRLATEWRGLHTGPPAIPLSQEKRRRADEFHDWFRDWLPAMLFDAGLAGKR